jgi:hypothetical protein
MNAGSGVALKSVLLLSAKPTGIACQDVETSHQRALGLGERSFAQAGVICIPTLLLHNDWILHCPDTRNYPHTELNHILC